MDPQLYRPSSADHCLDQRPGMRDTRSGRRVVGCTSPAVLIATQMDVQALQNVPFFLPKGGERQAEGVEIHVLCSSLSVIDRIGSLDSQARPVNFAARDLTQCNPKRGYLLLPKLRRLRDFLSLFFSLEFLYLVQLLERPILLYSCRDTKHPRPKQQP